MLLIAEKYRIYIETLNCKCTLKIKLNKLENAKKIMNPEISKTYS